MENQEITKHIDHTELKAVARWCDIEKLCQEAVRYKTASVCIPPSYIKRVKEQFGDGLTVCTVIGFPLGYNTTRCKVFEALEAIKDGADEIDMVINLGAVKDGEYSKVTQEIKEIRKAAEGKVLKVIVETCYLTDEEIINLCKCVTEAGADYIKTSTGFGTSGAKMSDIELFKRNIGESVKMKASGGIRTREQMEDFILAGCDRLGCSSGIAALYGHK